MANSGKLYIVATPIGNLGDISARALEVLRQVDLIAAEDTRHSAKLLQQFAITTATTSLHEHNEREKCSFLLRELQIGKNIALISDAGTPLISDPGYVMVKEAREQGIEVIPIPGCCAAITALSAAGLASDSFIFAGFLPVKSAARQTKLQSLRQETRTIIFYESKHRVVESIKDMATVFGDTREMVLARELTKAFETFKSGTIGEILNWITVNLEQQLGEFVLLVKGNEKTSEEQQEVSRILQILLSELSLKQAVKLAVQITGNKKREIYDMALAIQEQNEQTRSKE